MFKLIYSLLYTLALIIVLPVLYLYYKKKGYDFHLKERFLLKNKYTKAYNLDTLCKRWRDKNSTTNNKLSKNLPRL
jgi:hypothetical protein